MIGAGEWWIELDDGTGVERRHTTIEGVAQLKLGERLQGLLFGRQWRIDRVDPDLRWAVAVPDD
ncbi:MAG: hypothetical protein ACXVRZ_06495 [Gaiellaceae bacterium]